jgi:hypothetical protein
MLVLRMLCGTLPNRGCDYNGVSLEPASRMEEKGNRRVLKARNEEPAATQQKAANGIDKRQTALEIHTPSCDRVLLDIKVKTPLYS